MDIQSIYDLKRDLDFYSDHDLHILAKYYGLTLRSLSKQDLSWIIALKVYMNQKRSSMPNGELLEKIYQLLLKDRVDEVYDEGIDFEEDINSEQLYKKLLTIPEKNRNGSVWDMLGFLHDIVEPNGDPQISKTYFEKAINFNNIQAMNHLADMYIFGNRIPQNIKLGLELLAKASKLGDTEVVLADIYSNFQPSMYQDVPELKKFRDTNKAIYWYKKAIEKIRNDDPLYAKTLEKRVSSLSQPKIEKVSSEKRINELELAIVAGKEEAFDQLLSLLKKYGIPEHKYLRDIIFKYHECQNRLIYGYESDSD